jgi:hypothetical protein
MQLSCNWKLTLTAVVLLTTVALQAQESPLFVTYTHHMEEPGNLDIETSNTAGIPKRGQRFYLAPYMEFEYGVTAQWTSEFYLEGQATWADSTVFTGWRWENRYKPLQREHVINPVFYLEYENLNGASRIQKEIEGTAPDLTSRNALLRPIPDRELEGKIILSSDYRGWNFSENFIATKNFSQSEGVEFGYAIGVYRPLATLASGENCRWCRENFLAGMEMYGGLGSTRDFGLPDTAHYIAPAISWMISDNSAVRFSAGFGLSRETNPVLIRIGYTYEVQNVGSRIARLLGRR